MTDAAITLRRARTGDVRSIRSLVDRFPPETAVHPGHGASTTLGAELERNPFLAELRDDLDEWLPNPQVRTCHPLSAEADADRRGRSAPAQRPGRLAHSPAELETAEARLFAS